MDAEAGGDPAGEAGEMAARLMVHIGTPKTGSTSLQRALHDGAYSTTGARVAYPDRLSEVDLAQAMAKGRQKAVARRLRDIGRWLASTDADAFALSSEHFVRLPAGTFASAMDRHLPQWGARTHIVCYVRPHGPRLVSAFAQLRKSGSYLGSMDSFLQRFERSRKLRYAHRLAAWQELYGDRLLVRAMSSSSLVGGDVVADFLHLATPGTPVEVQARRLNPALTVEALSLLHLVHRALRERDLPPDVAHRIGKRIAADLNAAGVADRGRRLWLSASQARAVAAIFAEEATRLDDAFFPGSWPFTEALDRLAVGAPVEAPDLHAKAYADRETRRSIRRAATELADVSAEHARPWVAQSRAAKGYRHSSAALRSESVALVEEALEPVVAHLTAALRALP